jgi:hypothetical protein
MRKQIPHQDRLILLVLILTFCEISSLTSSSALATLAPESAVQPSIPSAQTHR